MNPFPGTNSSGPSTQITSRLKVTAKYSRLLSYWQLLTHGFVPPLLQFYLDNLVFGNYNQAHEPRRHVHFCGFSSLLQLLHRLCFGFPRWRSVLECIGQDDVAVLVGVSQVKILIAESSLPCLYNGNFQ